jgi:hypothetical protein
MNKAQKRTWLSFTVSLLTILIAAAVIVFIRVNQVDIYGQPGIFRLLSIACTIPLILVVLISRRFPGKDYDERDRLIEHKAMYWGILGAFVFLGGAGWFFTVITRMGSIRASLIISLVYLACFVWYLASSAAALIQYGWRNKNE